MPRPEAAPKRAAIGKLMKDFDKVKVNIQAILNESTLVKVVNERGEVESFARTGSAVSSASSSQKTSSNAVSGSAVGSNNNTSSVSSSLADEPPAPMTRAQQQQHMQQMKLQPLLQGQEVDDAILEEREQAIKQMNHDLVLVNEMFK